MHKNTCAPVPIREAKQKQEQLTWMGSQLYRRFHEGEISREVFLEEKSKIEKELEQWNRRETDFRRQEEMTEQEAEKRKQSISELLTGGADMDLLWGNCLGKSPSVSIFLLALKPL